MIFFELCPQYLKEGQAQLRQMLHKSRNVSRSILYNERGSNQAITLDTLPIILASVIKRVTKCKELQFRNRRINETKSLPNGNTILLEIESLTRDLPNNWTNEVMPKFIFRIYTPKDARPHNILMHSGGGGPGPRDGLEPAHSQEHPTLLKHSTEIMKPINLHINAARIFIPQRDNSLLSYKRWEINCSVTFLEDPKDS